jgi:hypothetical protein
MNTGTSKMPTTNVAPIACFVAVNALLWGSYLDVGNGVLEPSWRGLSLAYQPDRYF